MEAKLAIAWVALIAGLTLLVIDITAMVKGANNWTLTKVAVDLVIAGSGVWGITRHRAQSSVGR